MGVPLRLSPTRASRKLLALEFIKRHFADRGDAPSFGEIAIALNTSRGRVSDIVHRLADEGKLILQPGHRGIRLPDLADQISESDALRRLRELGYGIVLQAVYEVGTKTGLPGVEILDHIPDIETGGGGDDDGDTRRP
jgi:biotin operon repressor